MTVFDDAFTMVFAIACPAVLALVAWATAIGQWHGYRKPPTRWNPAGMSRARAADWDRPMASPAHWYHPDAADADTVRIGRVRDVTSHDDADVGTTWVTMTLDLADGSTTELHYGTTTALAEHARIGALVPVDSGRDGRSAVAGDAGTVRAALLDHKLHEGLIDEVEHRVLSTGRATVATVDALNPTGFLRRGHVEVTVHFVANDGSGARVTGFLRPEEVSTVRRTGTVPVSVDRSGQWALGPTWY